MSFTNSKISINSKSMKQQKNIIKTEKKNNKKKKIKTTQTKTNTHFN